MTGVWVSQSPLIPNEGGEWEENCENGWRITWIGEDGEEWSCSARFMRKIDAEMALAGLERAGITHHDLMSMPLEDEWEHEHIIYESLQW
jgi:hypothetical protein